jgi:NAD(P)-dependent dehydrogenase (short-subunit alcohol dehydrogenase family)
MSVWLANDCPACTLHLPDFKQNARFAKLNNPVKEEDSHMSSTVALVTGARRGIGRKVAEQFLASGADVIATCTDAEEASRLDRELNELGRGRALGVRLDVRDENQVNQLAEKIAQQFGKLDILVNNAGIMDKQPTRVETQTTQDWDDIIGTNLRGPFLMCRALVPLLKKSERGRIINLAGMLGTFSSGMEGGGFPAYRISKTGLNALTLVLAQELAADGIKVYGLDPGWVRTDLGGPDAPRSADEAAADVVSAATVTDDLPPSGSLLKFGKTIER